MAIFVLEIVTVPAVSTLLPAKSVAAPALICKPFPVVAILRFAEVTFTSPDPALITVVDVVFVEPIFNVLAAAPVARFTVVADASVDIEIAPVAELIPMVPVVARVKAPEPDCSVVADVLFVEPKVNALTPAPVAMFTVDAVASVAILVVPVPAFAVIAPLVAVSVKAPLPDCIVVADVLLVEPTVTPLTAAPVAIDTVVAAASVDMPKAPVPELTVNVPLVDVTANAPDPD